MRHQEYLSTARRLIREYCNRVQDFKPSFDVKYALLGAKTNWTATKRREVVRQLETETLPHNRTYVRAKVKAIIANWESKTLAAPLPTAARIRILKDETSWDEETCRSAIEDLEHPKPSKRVRVDKEKISFS